LRLQIPTSWQPYQAFVGDTGGTEWVNPADVNQRIAIVTTACQSCMQDLSNGTWSVRYLYGGDPGIQWTTVAANALRATFVDTDHLDQFCLNGDPNNPARGLTHEPYVAVGFAQIIQSPISEALEVFAWAPTNVAHNAINSVVVPSS
jgi:hypothetical protein